MNTGSFAIRRKSGLFSGRRGPFAISLLFLLSVQAFVAHATQLVDTEATLSYHRRLEESGSASSRSYRVMMSPFYLVLAKTPEELDDVELNDLFAVLGNVIETYIRSQLQETSTTLQYMFLRDMEGSFRNEQTTLSFLKGGVAQFTGSDVITSQSLDEWTQYALDFVLPGVLQSGGAGSAPLSQVEFSVYLTDGNVTPIIDDSPTPSNDNKNDIIIIVISVAATLAVVAAVALMVSRYCGPVSRQGDTKESGSVRTAEARSPASDRQPPASSIIIRDDRSEGSFTVNTEAGDSTAIKAVHNNLLAEGPINLAEAFQHESSRVNVRKDMLASTWVDDKSAPGPNLTPQVESVLAPSHFAASKEEQDRRMRMHQQIQAEAWDDEGEVSESAVRFESAHDDDEEEGKSAFIQSVSSF